MQSTTLKLMFTDFWRSFSLDTIENFWIYRLLAKNWNVEISAKPDFLIYSCFNFQGYQYLKYDCTRILYTGENIRPSFDKCDYAFSFDYPITERNYRLPLYRLYRQYNQLFVPRDVEKIVNSQREFCCFVVSNKKAKERIDFFSKLSEYKFVHSGGRALNNIGHNIPGSDEGKVNWMKNFKFSIVFENARYPGYTTEKLMHGLVAGTLPIYWGDPLVANDFNPKAFIDCSKFSSFDEAIEYVKHVDGNDALYREYLSQPLLPDNVETEYCREENILAQFDRIFSSKKFFVSITWKRVQKIEYHYHQTVFILTKVLCNLKTRLRLWLMKLLPKG